MDRCPGAVSHKLALYHGTVAHTKKFHHKNHTPKITCCCKPAIYRSFQTISGTFHALKSPKIAQKHAIFASKNAKNARFLLILHQKTRFLALKTDLKTLFFAKNRSKLYRAWYKFIIAKYPAAKPTSIFDIQYSLFDIQNHCTFLKS
jgi:hypothetical protein